MEIHTTIDLSQDEMGSDFMEDVKNHGVLSSQNYSQLLNKAKV